MIKLLLELLASLGLMVGLWTFLLVLLSLGELL